MEIVIRTTQLGKSFVLGNKKRIEVLKDINMEIVRGKLTLLKGRSGSGKTTLLNMLSALDYPTAGTVEFHGKDLATLTDAEKEVLRSKRMGFVFQSVALVPIMSAYENVDFALRLADYEGDRDRRIKELMERVGLKSRMHHMANQLSGGEQQRVAIARAIAHHPEVIFADEPTGALDTKTADRIFQLFHKLNQDMGLTILIVTHDISLAEKANRVVLISDGKISTEKIRKVHAATWENSQNLQEEYMVLDRAHRLQLSDEIMEKAGISTNKVCVTVENGKVVIIPEKRGS